MAQPLRTDDRSGGSFPTPGCGLPLTSQQRRDIDGTAHEAVRDPVTLFRSFYDALAVTDPEGFIFAGTITPRPDRLVRTVATYATMPAPTRDVLRALRSLGARHRLLGTNPDQYPLVGTALLKSLAASARRSWHGAAQGAWKRCYALVSGAMIDGAADGTCGELWPARILERVPLGGGMATVRLLPAGEFPRPLPGQHLMLSASRHGGLRRLYSVANASDTAPCLDIHVRRVREGGLSAWLVEEAIKGDEVLLRAPVGATVPVESDRDLLCVAGGTGIAPLCPLIEHTLTTTDRNVTLFVGGRTRRDLLCLGWLRSLAARSSRLTIHPVLSRDPGGARQIAALNGKLPGAVLVQPLIRHVEDYEVYVAGSPRLMRTMVLGLLARGLPASQLHFDATVLSSNPPRRD